ncbi:MAG: HAMP domain-containing sensor histidine kinase [Spirochaetales bacterium]|nr:HAMP domain-containing sensor histidine kinase [Spirochaetales bacterium]
MYKKTLLATALILAGLITVLFFFLIKGTEEKMISEKRKTERLIQSTAANGVHTIRNEILYLFEHYSDRMDEINETGWNGNLEALLLEEEYQLEDFPSIIKGIDYWKRGDGKKYGVLYREILSRLTKEKPEDPVIMIYIRDFQGYMIFPVREEGDEGYSGYIILLLDISSVVEEYLPAQLLSVLETSDEPGSGNGKLEYSLTLYEGCDFKNFEGDHQVVIDLNRDFNLYQLSDYYYTRADTFSPMPLSETVIDNHYYMVISHEEAEPGAFRKRKIQTYGLYSLLYIFLLAVLCLFFYSVYRIRQEYQREQQFTSLISHELKTPLSVIRLASDSLAGGYISEKDEVAEYGVMIKNETGRLGRMIENILLLSTLSWTGEEGEKISMKALLCDLEGANSSLLKSWNVSWKTENLWESGELRTRPSLLKSALQNVIHNGIVYGAAGSEDRILIVRAEGFKKKRREGVLFSVIDHGPGVSWSEAQKIFDNYFRGKRVREEQIPGSGMGLTLSRKIAEGLGGTLTINRSIKKETVFELWTPLGRGNEKNIDD